MNHRYPELRLKAGRDFSLRRGHPWLFSGAVASTGRHLQAGEIVTAVDEAGKPIGIGFYHPRNDIAFRLLTTDTSAIIDTDFWQQRVRAALALRRKVVPTGTSAYRLINAEGDGMPGLIVDRYGEILVFSIATAGMEKCCGTLTDVLARTLNPASICERSDGRARQMEGLTDRIGIIYGDAVPETIAITENDLHFFVDVLSGQKTGFFIDQRDNRQLMASLSMDATVLNGFSYTGAFSVYCARSGARRVVSVEASAPANRMAEKNLAANGLTPDQHPVIQGDIFTYLRETGEWFDLAIVDPPAFAKSRNDRERASRAYKDINLQAMRRLKEGGLLATFSCSNPIDEDLFAKIVLGAAKDAGKTVTMLRRLGPGADHPTDLAHPEGRYLKGLLLVVRT